MGRWTRPAPLGDRRRRQVGRAPASIDVHTPLRRRGAANPDWGSRGAYNGITITTVRLATARCPPVYANTEDAADLFSRVEAVPRRVRLRRLISAKTEKGVERRSAEYSRRSTLCRSGRMSDHCLVIRTCGPRCSGLSAATDDTVRPTMPIWTRWRSCSTRRSRPCGARHVRDGRGDRQNLDGDQVPVARAAVPPFATWRERRRLIKVLAQARPHSAESTRRRQPGGPR